MILGNGVHAHNDIPPAPPETETARLTPPGLLPSPGCSSMTQ